MWIWLLLTLCMTVASGSSDEDLSPMAEKYRPRYTLAADNKNKDNDDDSTLEKTINKQQPWRRFSSYALNNPWPLTGLVGLPAAAVLAPLLGPGLLLVGINLGALLYMLLSLLGLSPNRNLNDLYRHSSVGGSGGEDSGIYL